MNFMICSVFATGGIVSYNSNVGDFCIHELGFTSDQFNFALTIVGIAQLITSMLFVVMARYFTICAPFLYVLSVFGLGGLTMFILSAPSLETFYAAMAVMGFLKALFLSSLFAVCLEVSSPAQSVLTFMLETFMDGVGGLVFPYLVAYLQVNVDSRAGLALAGGLQGLGALLFLPMSVYYLTTPETYDKYDNIQENVKQTGFIPNIGRRM